MFKECLKSPNWSFSLGLLFFLSFFTTLNSANFTEDLLSQKKVYSLSLEPIDVVIPCIEKDLATLDLCIEGIKANVSNVRRIIVVSKNPLTRKAEWFLEKNYPFNTYDLALQIFHKDEEAAEYYSSQTAHIGWILQQLLKLYAAFVIPNISSNILIVDADTIFLNPVDFLGPNGEGLYNVGNDYHEPYFIHAAKLIPGLKRVYPQLCGITHHMLFQKEVLNDLFHIIENHHGTKAWKALCRCIDPHQFGHSPLSEYEIYFNFVFKRTDQVQIRPLKWANISQLSDIASYKKAGYHYVSCHAYLRKK